MRSIFSVSKQEREKKTHKTNEIKQEKKKATLIERRRKEEKHNKK
jgi:hypothetical protein